MPAGMIFWMLMILLFLGWLWGGYTWRNEPWVRGWGAGGVILFILLFLVGWKLFGFVVQ